MNWASLSSNDKLAVYGAAAVIIGALLGAGISGLIWLALLAAIAMLVIVFLPMMSPNTTLPGGRGSLMVAAGGIAAIAAVLALLLAFSNPFGGLGFWFEFAPLNAIFFLIAVVGGLVMGWAGWQAFQAEGGKFNVGAGGGGTTGGGTTGGGSTGGSMGAGTGTTAATTSTTTTTTERTDIDDRPTV